MTLLDKLKGDPDSASARTPEALLDDPPRVVVTGDVPVGHRVCHAAGLDDPPVQVVGLRKEYGAHVAVSEVDLEVRRGEVFALLGPNGAGKTVTMEILVGVRRRTSGSVRVLGEDPGSDRRAWRNRLGVVPQTTGEYLDLTVREVVTHFAAFYANPIPTDELLDRVGLTAKAKAQATALSGGQKRRLDVAVGVVGRPELIFLDEPTTGLDPEARHEAWQLVEYFRALGTTTVLTTHYLDEAEALADRAGIIADGRMLQVGTIPELAARAGGGTSIRFATIGEAAAVVPASLGRVSTQPGVTDPAETTTVVATEQPTEALTLLIAWARSLGQPELPGLTVHRPTLEDTYLRLINQRERT
ncbi:MAG TPA: ABC transporter ATP-binding protein [Mycobacteriales bacterium]|jgi:ABC-2 type transport system ATP-binding protein|nr:ABC transporter ATP-binding protein [Mycobacteriales bacterium]